MSPGATFERVYLALKEQLMSGRFEPGRRLEPAVLCDELNASITPVRDALHRLVGERVVAAPRNDGFHTPLLTEASLRDLYRWSEDLLLLALKRTSEGPSRTDALRSPDIAEDTAGLCGAIAAGSGSREQAAAMRSLNDRMHGIRRMESRVLPDARAELDLLWHAFLSGQRAELRHGLGGYHRRRIRAVAEIRTALGEGG